MDCMALMGRVLYIYYVNVVLLSTSKDRVEAIQIMIQRVAILRHEEAPAQSGVPANLP